MSEPIGVRLRRMRDEIDSLIAEFDQIAGVFGGSPPTESPRKKTVALHKSGMRRVMPEEVTVLAKSAERRNPGELRRDLLATMVKLGGKDVSWTDLRKALGGGDLKSVRGYAHYEGIGGMVSALQRLCKAGQIRRVRRGVYSLTEPGEEQAALPKRLSMNEVLGRLRVALPRAKMPENIFKFSDLTALAQAKDDEFHIVLSAAKHLMKEGVLKRVDRGIYEYLPPQPTQE